MGKLRTCWRTAASWQQVVVMDLGNDTTDTTDFCQRQLVTDLLRICSLCCGLVTDLLRGSRQLVMDLLRGNWCNGFWPLAGTASMWPSWHLYCGRHCHGLWPSLMWPSLTIMVRTILVLGNWVLGNICRYWVVLLLAGDIFFHCDTQYNTHQTAVSTFHMITIQTSVVRLLSADDGRESGEWVECKLYIIIQFWDFTWYSVVSYFTSKSIHCYAAH